MSCCEKCWSDAGRMAHGFDSKVDIYNELLDERKDNPCTPREQAGQWWDEEKQCDTRIEANNMNTDEDSPK